MKWRGRRRGEVAPESPKGISSEFHFSWQHLTEPRDLSNFRSLSRFLSSFVLILSLSFHEFLPLKRKGKLLSLLLYPWDRLDQSHNVWMLRTHHTDYYQGLELDLSKTSSSTLFRIFAFPLFPFPFFFSPQTCVSFSPCTLSLVFVLFIFFVSLSLSFHGIEKENKKRTRSYSRNITSILSSSSLISSLLNIRSLPFLIPFRTFYYFLSLSLTLFQSCILEKEKKYQKQLIPLYL